MQNVSNIPNMQSQPVLQQQPNYGTPPASQPNPNYAGVNIQIFNPMVGSPTGSIYPAQTTSAYDAGTQGGCYPAGYYTGQYPQGTFIPQNPYGQVPNNPGAQTSSNLNSGTIGGQQGTYDTNGVYYPQNPDGHPIPGTTPVNAEEIKNDETTQNEPAIKQPETTEQPENVTSDSSNNENKTNTATEPEKSTKTEKRKIVELSDDYIKTLENYLNSQDSEVRLMGAKEVVSRAMEDDSRKDDPALTALVNKMLQDPSSAIRAVALSLIDSRTILGDDYTVNVLKKMQTSQDGFGQDSVQATSALLKMAGKTVEKEFEIKETQKADKK